MRMVIGEAVSLTVPLLVLALVVRDRVPRYLFVAIAWGSVAAAAAYLINSAFLSGAAAYGELSGARPAYPSGGLGVVPPRLILAVIEEVIKGFPWFLFGAGGILGRAGTVFRRLPQFEPGQWLSWAYAIATGFAIQETMLVLAHHPGIERPVAFSVARSLSTGLMHVAATGAFAIVLVSVARAVTRRCMPVAPQAGMLPTGIALLSAAAGAALGLVAATLIHFGFNTLVSWQRGLLAESFAVGAFVLTMVASRPVASGRADHRQPLTGDMIASPPAASPPTGNHPERRSAARNRD